MDNKELTFNDLPQVVAQLRDEVMGMRTLLIRQQEVELEMATHSIILAWKIPWTEEPGRLRSMRSLRVGHN